MKEGHGFIQKNSAKPCYILFWSEEGLQFASKSALFWDATGSVVGRENDKQYLYYELAIQHPVRGKMGLPLTAMITEDQSLPCVQDWIARFRHAEKKLFGHNNSSRPQIIISDDSWVFIIAALKEFNTETLQEFLERTWNFCFGKQVEKTNCNKTIGKSHFMKKVRRFCMVHYKRNTKLGMYMVSLLLNSKSIDEATEILHDIVVTLQSRTISEKKNQGCIDRLIGKVNTFDTSIFSELLTDEEGISAQFDPTRVPPGRFTEEEFLNPCQFFSF